MRPLLAAVLIVVLVVPCAVGVALVVRAISGGASNGDGSSVLDLANDPGAVTADSCTAALHGSSLSVTVVGSDANFQCSSYLSNTVSGATWYIADPGDLPTLQGTVICELTAGDDEYTVRDGDAGHYYGNAVCLHLEKYAAGAAPGSTPMPRGSVACAIEVNGHDATMLASSAVCGNFATAYPPAGNDSWVSPVTTALPYGDSLICAGNWQGAHVEIWDSGGRFYGNDLCQRLNWA